MLTTLIDEIKAAPERLRTTPKRLRAKRVDWVRTARHRAHLARGEGQERLWNLETQALENVVHLLKNVEEVPVVGRVVPAAERVVNGRLDTVTDVPIEGYDVMNAKTASRAVVGLSWVELLQVERFEKANRDRKTVYAAIERARTRLRSKPSALAS